MGCCKIALRARELTNAEARRLERWYASEWEKAFLVRQRRVSWYS